MLYYNMNINIKYYESINNLTIFKILLKIKGEQSKIIYG